MTVDYEAIGKRIRAQRRAKGRTQVYLSELSGIEPSNLSHIERAATKLSLPTLLHIANALQVSADTLVYGNLVCSAHVSVALIDELLQDCTDDELRAIAEIVKTTKKVLRTRRQ